MKRSPGLLATGLLAWLLTPTVGLAQSLGINPQQATPRWLAGWSALENQADLPRRLLGAGHAASAFLEGEPRTGLFWTGGNPAGLVDEISAPRTDFSGAWARQHGDFRRPLDPGAVDLLQASARSWKAVTPAFAVLGRAAMDRERLDPGTVADLTQPFASSPFITIDTSAAPMRRIRTLLEGVASWRVGEWGLGATLGYEARENTSIVSPVVRRISVQTPGIVLGAARLFGGTRVGLHGRYRHRAESILLSERAGDARVYEFIGWTEPPAIDVIGSYYRRREENSASAGMSAAGSLGSLRYGLVVEAHRVRERLWDQERNDPDRDRWDANGWSAGMALQQPLAPGLMLTLQGNVASLDGDALPQRDSIVGFTTSEGVADLEVEVRRRHVRSPLELVIAAGFRREWRDRQDERLILGTTARTNSLSARVEIGWRAAERWFVSAGGALSASGATSRIPDPAVLGPLYRQHLAPEFGIIASDASARAVLGYVSYRVGSQSSLWGSIRTEGLSPNGLASFSFRPGGDRTSTSVTAGITTGIP